jgi:hypothetical protein
MSSHWPTADQQPGATPAQIEFARRWRDMPKVVFSSTTSAVDWNARLVTGDAVTEITRLKTEDGGPVDVGGATLAAAATEVKMSVGNPQQQEPEPNESLGFARSSLPIHLGGFDCFLVRNACTRPTLRAAASRCADRRGQPVLAPDGHRRRALRNGPDILSRARAIAGIRSPRRAEHFQYGSADHLGGTGIEAAAIVR